MGFVEDTLAAPRPDALATLDMPRRQHYHPPPDSWAAHTSGRYPFGEWRGDQGQAIMTMTGGEDSVWPSEFQDPDRYIRAGTGSLDASKFPDVDQAEFRRTDFEDLRDFALDAPER
jgi:hypothetical protein